MTHSAHSPQPPRIGRLQLMQSRMSSENGIAAQQAAQTGTVSATDASGGSGSGSGPPQVMQVVRCGHRTVTIPSTIVRSNAVTPGRSSPRG